MTQYKHFLPKFLAISRSLAKEGALLALVSLDPRSKRCGEAFGRFGLNKTRTSIDCFILGNVKPAFCFMDFKRNPIRFPITTWKRRTNVSKSTGRRKHH